MMAPMAPSSAQDILPLNASDRPVTIATSFPDRINRIVQILTLTAEHAVWLSMLTAGVLCEKEQMRVRACKGAEF